MVFVDAPHVIDVPTVGAGAFEKFTDAELIPRAWWSSKEPEQTGLPHKVYEGLDGAALAAVLSSVLEYPNLHTAFSDLKDQTDGQKAFKAVVLVAGFKLDLPPEWYGVRPDSDNRSEPLVSAFMNPRVEWHDGSHFVPSKKSWRDFFCNYVQKLDQTDESLIPSPGQTELIIQKTFGQHLLAYGDILHSTKQQCIYNLLEQMTPRTQHKSW
ncbi:uncharacterized protein MELLADRAFT_101314 [Melampsora larici-populina 98AG31]|uniref:Serine hydrolase domain-containing protein n=1 Tax=Melampsora larici-populina (strain 98AG31 / pathotype 3-4-7) TaxID=747676 RepID=F4R4B8_MELLP|nr:uncharacterized protein MELLADRAFT_101314 [Melampsora larici-populina 98AG31]EGG12783.1 hypothetical protein MELLADRAFT_101314 [Melampsora larici-populina 98AG31]